MNGNLPSAQLKKYLEYDVLDLCQAIFILFGYRPLTKEEFLNTLEYGLTSERRRFYEMASAGIKAGTISPFQVNGPKVAVSITVNRPYDFLNFSTKPMIWIEWAISKGFKIHKVWQNAYDEAQKQKNVPRNSESYRPKDENADKIIAQQLIKTIHEFIPELPLTQLVRTPPIKRVFQNTYSPDTLMKWAKEVGISTKVGNIKEETKQKCLQSMPKSWNFEWFKND
jgi:hypothetical protein